MSSAMRLGATRLAAKLISRPAGHQQTRSLATGTPPRILELQKRFNQNPELHGADDPTYLKKGTTDYVVNIIGGVLVFTSLFKIGNGLYHMAHGTNKLDVV